MAFWKAEEYIVDAYWFLQWDKSRPTCEYMKVLSVEEAQGRLAAVCDEALAGEVIRLRLKNGASLELMPLPAVPGAYSLSSKELAECYEDEEWAAFENHCSQTRD